MAAYFFHLKLELYPAAQAPPPSAASQAAASSNHNHNHNNPIFVPTPETDIFKTPFPAHRTSKSIAHSLRHRHSPAASLDGQGSPAAKSRPASAHGDALLLPERNVALKEPASPVIPPTKASSQAAARDWRYGPVSIESIDMEATKVPSSGLHTKAVYLPSTPKSTDVGWGVVHLYRDSQETAALDHKLVKDDPDFDPNQCTTLCILAVPSWMMPSDLLGFVGDQTREDVSHFRLIRTGRANKYMVLMKFRHAKRAREWQKLWNGKLFSAMEVCTYRVCVVNC